MTQQPTQTATTAVAKKPLDIAAIAQSQIDKLISENGIVLPDNYAVGNAIQEAYLAILDVKDKNSQPALAVCDQASVVRSIRNMVIQGLTVGKKQGYFIVYGNQLNFQRSYFGTIAVAKRFAGVLGEPTAMIVIKGDETDTEIINGEERVTKHARKNRFEQTITFDNIIGAYCIVHLRNGGVKWEVMDG
jgi:recombination protein RecT